MNNRFVSSEVEFTEAAIYEGKPVAEKQSTITLRSAFDKLWREAHHRPQQFALVVVEPTRLVYRYTLSDHLSKGVRLESGERVSCQEMQDEIRGTVEQVHCLTELIILLYALEPCVGMEKITEVIQEFQPTKPSFLPGLVLANAIDFGMETQAHQHILGLYGVRADDVRILRTARSIQPAAVEFRIWDECELWIEVGSAMWTFGQIVRDMIAPPARKLLAP